MNIVEMKNIHKTYAAGRNNSVHALRGVDFTLEQGSFTAVIGVPGSGKSTLLHIIGCLDTFDRGAYYFNGQAAERFTGKMLARVRNKEIGFVLQNFGLILGKSVYDNLALPLLLAPDVKWREIRSKVSEILEILGLEEKREALAEALSGGQQQRIAIGRAVIHSPKLLIADEPTGALDRETAGQVMELFEKTNRDFGMTVLLATHDPFVYEKCRYVVRLEDGNIIDEYRQIPKDQRYADFGPGEGGI